jgi:putative ABC transport system substrate-binding protein
MRRRAACLIAIAIAAALALVPLAARAQQSAKRREIAILTPGGASGLEAEQLRQGLRALRFGDEDTAIEIRGAEGHVERLPGLAAEVVRLASVVIVALGPAAVQAAKQATSTIPIVMVNVADPVGAGLVASLARPGGNVTGLANLAHETVGKRLQLLKSVIPSAARVAILFNPGNAGNVLQLQAAKQAAQTLAVELLPVEVRIPDEIDGAFGAMTREHVDAFFVPDDPVFGLTASTITDLAVRSKLPTIFQSRRSVSAGGLMSYGTDLNDLYRRVSVYVDKILKGAKPADLPVEQPTKFELVINLKTAKALGLTVPPGMLDLADEVIE